MCGITRHTSHGKPRHLASAQNATCARCLWAFRGARTVSKQSGKCKGRTLETHTPCFNGMAARAKGMCMACYEASRRYARRIAKYVEGIA